jgi:uncharacterized protein
VIIDIHAHTSNHRLYDLHVKSATIADLEKRASQFGITKTILMATYFPFKGSGVHNKKLLFRVSDSSGFLIFGSLDAMGDLEAGISELRELAESGSIAGIKLYPGYQDFDFTSKEIEEVYEIAEEYNLPVAFHTGELHHCCPKDKSGKRENRCGRECRIDLLGHLAHPYHLANMATKFPDVRFIFCHLSNPFFGELRQVMNECDNVYTDISGQFVSGSHESTPEYKKQISRELEKFVFLRNGIDRVMFGTDFPIQSHKDSMEIVKSLRLPKREEERVFYGNAIELLGL